MAILEDLRELFDHFDPNKTGSISIRHYHTIIAIFGKHGAKRLPMENEMQEIIDSKSATWANVLNVITKIYR